MGTAEEWHRVCDALMAAEEPESSPEVRRLYALARQAGIAALRRKWSYSEEDAMDVVHDVLATRFRTIVEAEHPRALFLRILTNQAISLHRHRKPDVPDPGPEHEPPRAAARLELGEVLALLRCELSPRDLSVFTSRCLGASSKEVAEAEGLSVANVDQIVSRARARLKERLDADPE